MAKKAKPKPAPHVRPIEAWGLRLPVTITAVGPSGAQFFKASVTYGALTLTTALFGNVTDAADHLTRLVTADADQALRREIEMDKLRAWNAGAPRKVASNV